MQRLHYRPHGAGPALAMFVLAWLLVALLAVGAFVLGRWGYLGYLDSLWLYVLIGGIGLAAPVGWVARGPADAMWWSAQVIIVSMAALIAERVWGPGCLGGNANCMSFGAQGEWGTWGVSLAMGAGFALLVSISGLVSSWIQDRRPLGSGSTRTRSMLTSMLLATILVGVPVAFTGLLLESVTRSGPAAAKLAVAEVELDCFGFTEPIPDLAVRPHPRPTTSGSFLYLVGIDGDDRRQPDESRYTAADRRGGPTPYEAVVRVTRSLRIPSIQCRFIHPSVEQVTDTQLTLDAGLARQEFPDSEALQAPVAIIPVPGPPGDERPDDLDERPVPGSEDEDDSTDGEDTGDTGAEAEDE